MKYRAVIEFEDRLPEGSRTGYDGQVYPVYGPVTPNMIHFAMTYGHGYQFKNVVCTSVIVVDSNTELPPIETITFGNS